MPSEQVMAEVSTSERGLYELFAYCFEGRPLDRITLRIAMRRFVAVTWMLHSELLVGQNGEPLTLAQLARLPQLRCSRCALSISAREFGKKWKFRTRVQKRDGSKPNYAQSARKGWEVRRQREALRDAK